MERLETEAEAAAERKDMKTVYQITRKLRGDRGQNQDLTIVVVVVELPQAPEDDPQKR